LTSGKCKFWAVGLGTAFDAILQFGSASQFRQSFGDLSSKETSFMLVSKLQCVFGRFYGEFDPGSG